MNLARASQGDILRSLARARRTNPLAFYQASLGQRHFHESDHLRRLIRAGTQVGKSHAGAAEAWWLAMGEHPFREVKPAPTHGIILTADWTAERAVVGARLHELAPRHLLKPKNDYNPKRGWRNRLIELTNGSTIQFRSGKIPSDTTSAAGVAADWGWIDEPPYPELFFEMIGRVVANNGPLYLTATMVGRPVDWLRLHVEGDASEGIEPTEEWEQHVIPLSVENCPHRTPASIQAQISGYSRWQYAQRVLAAWEGVIDERMLDGFTETNEDGHVPHLRWSVGLGMDHGEGAGRQVCLLVLYNVEHSRLWVIDEYISKGSTDPDADAVAIREMLKRHNIGRAAVDLAVGDTNTLGKAGAGRAVNDLLAEELGIRIEKAQKGPGSIDYGTVLLNTAARRGHLRVHPRCVRTLRSIKNWCGADDEFKHAIDALRYIGVPVLETFYSRSDLDRLRLARA